MLADAERRSLLGCTARSLAEQEFAIDGAADRFQAILVQAVEWRRSPASTRERRLRSGYLLLPTDRSR